MVASRDEILKDALTLRADERAELAGALLRSLESTSDARAGEAWRVEIERRAQEVETGAVKAVPWESVRERLVRAPRG
jgi:putative addiction module component (TIGR02574 family)